MLAGGFDSPHPHSSKMDFFCCMDDIFLLDPVRSLFVQVALCLVHFQLVFCILYIDILQLLSSQLQLRLPLLALQSFMHELTGRPLHKSLCAGHPGPSTNPALTSIPDIRRRMVPLNSLLLLIPRTHAQTRRRPPMAPPADHPRLLHRAPEAAVPTKVQT